MRRATARGLFQDFHRQFGTRMRLLVTGMAPIRRNIGSFFELLQLPLCESYGMQEAGSITVRPPGSRNYGSVGKVLKGIEVFIQDDNEIIIKRSAPMSLRYFQSAEGENERTFIGPGRIATGDMGRLDADDNLYLMGRKKEILVTPGGLKIHPEAIEQELNNCPDVAHAIIFLKPHATYLSCVVDLVSPGTDEARVRVSKLANSMPAVKRVAQYVEMLFADEPFSRENGMLRPNLKIDRKAIVARYFSGPAQT